MTTMRQRKRSFCTLWLLGFGHSHVWFRSFDGLTRSGKPALRRHLLPKANAIRDDEAMEPARRAVRWLATRIGADL